jgi:formylglycine-generating enzyme required for sulfatase activity
MTNPLNGLTDKFGNAKEWVADKLGGLLEWIN